jgi:hypothetical protein
MDALKIALETVLVGALALPWMALAIQFFFPAGAYFGWYWTEILYDRLVIYSFYADHHL